MIHLFQRDCVGALRALPRGCLDVVVTSPPYNIGVDYGLYEDGGTRGEYLDWMQSWGAAVHHALTPQGSLFLNVGSKPTDPMVPYEVLKVMAGLFVLQNTIHWVKSFSAGDEPCQGHVKPINSARFLNDAHEFIFHLTPTGHTPLDKLAVGVPFADKSNLTRGSRGQHGDLRDRGNVWFIPYRTIQSRTADRPHPATFPVELPERCFRLHGLDRIQNACDPFLGLGASAVAAAMLGLNFVGYEIDLEYLTEARLRVAALAEGGSDG